MAQAAYLKLLQVATKADSPVWLTLPVTSPTLDNTAEVLETTSLEDNQVGFRTRKLGLADWSVSADANYDSSDPAIKLVRNALIGRLNILIRYLPDGVSSLANGWQGEVVVESFNVSGEVAGLESVSMSFLANGGLSVAS